MILLPSPRPAPGEPPVDEAVGAGWTGLVPSLSLALGAVLLGLAAGWIAVHFSGAIHLRPSWVHGVALLVAVAAMVALLRRPELGLVALVLLVYLNLSDVLIRRFDLPSPLQLLAIPLVVAALVEWRGDLVEGLRPWGVTVALIAWVLVVFASSGVAVEPGLADGRAAAAGKAFVIYALILLLTTTPARARAGAWALVGGGLIVAGLALVQVATGGGAHDFGGLARMELAQLYGDVREARVGGPVGDPNFFAQILVIVFPVAFFLGLKERSRTLRFLALAAAAAVTAGVVFTYSRGGALALAVVMVCCLFAARPSRTRLTVGGALVLLAALLVTSSGFGRRLATLGELGSGDTQVAELDTSLQSRILWARVAWRMFLDHPVLGVGAGNYTTHYYEYANEIGSSAPEYERAGGDHYPHDLYLEVASETGLVGLLAFGAAVLLVLGNLHRAEATFFREGQERTAAIASAVQIALLGYLTSSLFLHGHFQRYLWILLGLAVALARMAPTTALDHRRAEA